MGPTNGFGEHHRHVDALNFGAILHVAILGNCVGHHNRLEARVVDARNRRSTEDSVREDRVDFRCSGFEQFFGGVARRPARVCHVVDEDSDAIFHVTDEHHRGDFVRLLSLFVDQSEFDVESIGDGRDTLGTAGIRRHNDGVPPLRDVFLDPFKHGRLGVQIVDGNVEKALEKSQKSRNFQKNISISLTCICDA